METQEFWLEKEYITDGVIPKNWSPKCIKIMVPKQCPVCSRPIKTWDGSARSRSCLSDFCQHFNYGKDEAGMIKVWKHSHHLNPWLNLCSQCGKEHK
jgi:hypothetical protein